jgi:pimeloyl-ACP methyl ester carboxylesterase
MEFFKEVGGNIYFLEPYDPRKIPILFVHGAGGSPQDWRYFFDHIDRSRYQPWFFYYPSGSTIDSTAHLLFWKLFNLQLRYRFEKIYITAHSMGGLVVRSFLLNHGAQVPTVKLFVSMSTPWGGEATAELGVKNSPAVVPSWNDMQPNGHYMRSLFARKLPAGVDYYLLFGYKGGYSMMRPNNDGTVTLASELRKPAQAEAKMVYGFDEDHVGILSSPQVLAQYQAILDASGERRGADAALQSGRVKVNFSFAAPSDGLGPQPLLILQPIDHQQAPITIPLVAGDEGGDVGPIPAGDYDASLVADSFKTEARNVRVSVASGQTPTMKFQLTAQGTFWGYVGTGQADIPAGSYVPPDESVEIDSITLSGVGIERKLVPRTHEDGREVDRYLAGADDAVKAYFRFIDLPPGEYVLTVRANGYLPYSDRITVESGRPGQWKPIILRAGE